MKKTLTLLALLIATIGIAQVGINTDNPKVTLHVIGANDNGAVTGKDGVLVPRVTNLTTDGTEDGQLVYLTTNIGAYRKGFHYWNADNSGSWLPVASTGVIKVGDIKSGFQPSDHDGWYKLDGRSISGLGLTTSQTSNANSIGITSTLPNANNAVLMQSTRSLRSVNSSNSKTIARRNLPNVTLSGTTSNGGSHGHGIYAMKAHGADRTGGRYASSRDFSDSGNQLSTISTNAGGNHSHSFTTSSINGGLSQTSLDVTPRNLSVNMFVYLGQ